jgi:very-short-patch-repair endonuclease
MNNEDINNDYTLPRKHNQILVPFAKILRKNMTKEEKHLWYDFLRKYPVKFTRQKVLGLYIADFYSAEAHIVIELDGSQHYTTEAKAYDENRTLFLEEYGLRVIRINNMEINRNFEGVCRYIDKIVQESLENM